MGTSDPNRESETQVEKTEKTETVEKTEEKTETVEPASDDN